MELREGSQSTAGAPSFALVSQAVGPHSCWSGAGLPGAQAQNQPGHGLIWLADTAFLGV